MQFKKCITPLFKIDLNIFVIYKIIKIEIPIRENQNIHKGETKHPQMGNKTPIERITKDMDKRDNKNKIKNIKP